MRAGRRHGGDARRAGRRGRMMAPGARRRPGRRCALTGRTVGSDTASSAPRCRRCPLGLLQAQQGDLPRRADPATGLQPRRAPGLRHQRRRPRRQRRRLRRRPVRPRRRPVLQSFDGGPDIVGSIRAAPAQATRPWTARPTQDAGHLLDPLRHAGHGPQRAAQEGQAVRAPVRPAQQAAAALRHDRQRRARPRPAAPGRRRRPAQLPGLLLRDVPGGDLLRALPEQARPRGPRRPRRRRLLHQPPDQGPAGADQRVRARARALLPGLRRRPGQLPGLRRQRPARGVRRARRAGQRAPDPGPGRQPLGLDGRPAARDRRRHPQRHDLQPVPQGVLVAVHRPGAGRRRQR